MALNQWSDEEGHNIRWNAFKLFINALYNFGQIIHLDITARIVLVGEHDWCKVTDFGMARGVPGKHLRKEIQGITIYYVFGSYRYLSVLIYAILTSCFFVSQ